MIFQLQTRNKIAEAIASAEGKTSGEIVPVYVEQSNSYSPFTHWVALVGCLMASALGALLWWKYPFFGLPYFVGIQVSGWLLGWVIGKSGFFFRLCHSKKNLQFMVHEAAVASFFRNGLHRTKDRTGVLIYISEFEHYVEILADEGIHQKVASDFWQMEVTKLSQAIKDEKISEVLPQVIQEIGQKLSEFFPKTANDQNEISNSLRSN